MKTTKKNKQPVVPPPVNIMATESPMVQTIERDRTFAEKLTTKIERQLREINDLRDGIGYLEKELANKKDALSTVLLNHQSAQFELQKTLDVPSIAH